MIKKYLIIALIVLLSGVAWAQSPENAASDQTVNIQLPATPQKGFAMVYVLRPSGTDPFSNVYIYLDGKSGKNRIGYIKGVEYLYFQVTPGKHRIFSQGRNWKYIDVEVKDGKILFLMQPIKLDIDRTNVDNMEIMDATIGKNYVTNLRMGTLDPPKAK